MRLILLIVLFLTSPALANQLEYKGGINHTYIRKNPPPLPEAIEPEAGEEAPTAKVWEKYKALARGKSQDETAQEEPEAPTAPVAPETPRKPTGMAAILEQYQANKSNRSQMRSLTMNRPETPAVEKPLTDQPQSTGTQ